MTTGEKIKSLRKELKLTQSELAGKEMTKSMLSQIENNNAMPSMKNLKHLANKLGKPISYFLDENTLNENIPIEKIKSKIKIADEYMTNRESEKVIEVLDDILNNYDINKNSKLYADILYKNGASQVNLMNFEVSDKYLKKAVEIYKQHNLYSYAAKAYMEFFGRYWNEQNYDKCLKILSEAYELYMNSTTEDITFHLEYLSNKSLILSSMGKINESFKPIDDAINLSKETNVYYNTGELYRLKGNLNRVIENYENVLYYFEKAKLFAQFTDNELDLAILEFNFSVYYTDINEPIKALEYLKRAREMFKNTPHYPNHLFHNQLAIVYYMLEEYQKAYDEIRKTTFRNLLFHKADYVNMWLGKVYEGMILSKLGNINQAIESINKGIEMMSKVGISKYLSFAYKELSNIYSEIDDYKNAFKSLKKSEQILKELNGNPF
ncbi:helix-turn-helix transcriptional regulator [Senegalia massiliensis]|uniref:helix-turn-helix transcriptional regulator n=1 Tax=Senegalia massiliensis TaxID=1720316 RepID=UPI0013EF0B4E|nr:helix-turn-helix transcriptional regulator [Senegalia massiliensis]